MDQQPVTENKTFELLPLTPEQHRVSAPPRRTTDLPFFYLTKKKELLEQPIHYEGADENNRPIRWTVTPNTIIGAPAIDAHKIWLQLVIPTIEQYRAKTGQVPQILPLGGVRKCLRLIGLTEGGRQARQLLEGLNRIASAWCEADFFVPVQDANNRIRLVPIKGKFSRLSIYAIGEKHLTDDQLAAGKFDFDFDLDATLYLQLHQLEMLIQENQEHRYIDNQYMFSVEPTGRRWLEIMGPKIFGVVKNNGTHCEIHYSWYVKHHHTLQRQTARFRMVEQMNRVAADHIASGYILKPEYRTLKESEKEIDLLIRYTPGPMARESTNRIRANLRHPPTIAEPTPAQKLDSAQHAGRPRQRRLNLVPPTEPQPQPAVPAVVIDYRIIAELAKRGVGETDARQLLAALPPGQPILDQLEYGDHLIAQKKGKITNPPGFYISLLQRNVPIPPSFETSQARKARQEAEFAKRQAFQNEQAAALAAEEAEEVRLTAQFEQLPEPDRLALLLQVKAEQLKKYPNMAHWLKTNPGADSFLKAGARRKLREGWQLPAAQSEPKHPEKAQTSQSGNPHYATNPPVRQADRLQEIAPVQTVAEQPQPAPGYPLENLAAVLATPQLPAPAAVEQSAVKPAPAAESQPAKPSIDPQQP